MSMQDRNTLALNHLLSKNFPFHSILEMEVQETPYGSITFNFEVRDGVVALETLNIVKNRRKRYQLTKNTAKC